MSLEASLGACGGQGSQIQKGAVTQGVAGGVVWCVWGQGSQVQDGQDGAVTEGVAGGVVWCVVQGSQIQKGAVIEGVVGGVACVWGSGFADPKGGCHTRCRWRCRLVCVGVRVRRSKTGLSQRVSLEVSFGVCGGQGLQIRKGVVIEGVVGGVAWCVWGSGFADPKGGCHTRCRWRCRLVCVGVRVRRSKTGQGVAGGVVWCVCGGQGLQIRKGVVKGVVGGVAWCMGDGSPDWFSKLHGWMGGGSGRCIKSTTNSTKSTKREESDIFSPVLNQTKTKMKDEKDGKDTWEGQVN